MLECYLPLVAVLDGLDAHNPARITLSLSQPLIGMLDDAVMIELVFRELRHELEAYEDFRAYRESLTKGSVLRKAAPGVAEKIDRRRAQLMARMRRRRKSAQ